MFFKAVLTLILGISSVWAQNNGQNLGGVEVRPDQTLVFGGSFSPPTLEHLGLVTRLMSRFGFSKAKMLVTTPYKPGAAPAQVSLHLSRLAVQNLDEVLRVNSIEYKDFQATQMGQATWTGSGEKHFELLVDDYEIQHGIKENALHTIRAFREQAGAPKKNFWLTGGDSFAGIPKWTPDWRELFEHTNWIIVSRSGGHPNSHVIRFKDSNPLLGVLGEEFLKNYLYYFDQTHQIHVYRNRDLQKPDLYVIDQPVLKDSSTENRKSLAEQGDHEHAQAGLQPSVFKECLKKGYFTNQTETGYRVFSRKNLEIYLNHLLAQASEKSLNSDQTNLTLEELEDFREMSQVLIEIASQTAQLQTSKPKLIAFLSTLYEHLIESISELKDIRHISKKIRALSKKYGIRTFAAVYVALEIAETTVFPALMYYLAGPGGLALAPFLHPNEVITIPAYILWRVWKARDEKIRRAGSIELFYELTNYRNRLLRGDPDAIIARVKLQEELGLGNTELTLNMIKSRLPKWVPLWIRKWDDKKVVWHDLNLSTNELSAILNDVHLNAELLESAGENLEMLSHFLLNAVLARAQPRLTFKLFVLSRYFSRIALGRVSNEILSGFNPIEQNKIREIYAQSEPYRTGLSESDQTTLSEVLGMIYAVSKVLPKESTLKPTESWDLAFNLLLTKYPGIKPTRKLTHHQKLLQLLFFQGLHHLGFEVPEEFSRPSPLPSIRFEILSHALDRYLTLYQELFLNDKKENANSVKSNYVPLPISTQEQSQLQGNLIWEIRLYRDLMIREFKTLEKGFENSIRYLRVRERHPRAERAFVQSQDVIENALTLLHRKLRDLEYRWLKLKYPHFLGRASEDEKSISGYAGIVKQYVDLKSQFEEKLYALRQLNQMMTGLIVVNLMDIENLRDSLAHLTKLDLVERQFLGLNLCERALMWGVSLVKPARVAALDKDA